MNIDQVFKQTEEKITLHGLGFLQVVLQGNQRLHVWHPGLPRRACFKDSAIHNHRFGFVSRVLIGTQINHEIAILEEYDSVKQTSIFLHDAYLHEGERTKFGNRPWIKDKIFHIYPRVTQNVPAGESYTMHAYDFHWTEPGGDGKVATIMKKTWEGTKGAHSLCRVGVEPDVDFDRKQWSQGQLWQIVEDVLLGSGQ